MANITNANLNHNGILRMDRDAYLIPPDPDPFVCENCGSGFHYEEGFVYDLSLSEWNGKQVYRWNESHNLCDNCATEELLTHSDNIYAYLKNKNNSSKDVERAKAFFAELLERI